MKNLILILTLSVIGLSLSLAAPVAVTTANGIASVSNGTNAFYFIAWRAPGNGLTNNTLVAYRYVIPAPGKTPSAHTPFNAYASTTYGEASNFASTNHLVPALPAQEPGQP